MRRTSRRGLPLLALLPAIGVPHALASCAESASSDDRRVDAAAATETGAPLPSVESGCKPDRWCRVDLPPSPVSLNGIWGSGPNDVWIAGTPAVTIHWNGSRLALSKLETTQALFGIWGSGQEDVWTFSSQTSTWHTRGFAGSEPGWARSVVEDAGQTGWPMPIYAIWGASATDVWAVGASLPASGQDARPTVYHSDGWQDGGPAWRPSGTSSADPPAPEPITFNAVCGGSGSPVWIVGSRGRVRYTTGWNGDGTVWTPANSETSRELYAAWCSPNGDVWVGGEGGTIRRFARDKDGVYSVTSVDIPVTASIRALWGSGPDDVWAAGSTGTIVRFDGKAWNLAEEPLRSATTEELFAIWGASSSEVWIAGRNVLLHLGSTPPSGKPL